jgi:YfiH family protein
MTGTSRFRVLSRDKIAQHAFSTADEGDLRSGDRHPFSLAHGFSPAWATVNQVHGSDVLTVSVPGDSGEADALVTTTPGLPLSIFTADCLGVVFESERAVGVAHAGWRGLDAGVLEATSEMMTGLGGAPVRAIVGPAIRACCFEVGPEVAELFPQSLGTTSWGTVSVDLIGEARRRLPGTRLEEYGGCTRCDDRYFSFRNGDRTVRMASVGWIG